MTREPRRRTPDELLRAVQAEEAATSRGRLKIFLGYASGVGKSFRMLGEASRRRERGQDVVVAAMQPQVPAEISAVLSNLEVYPMIRSGGVDVMDIDGLLRRRPSVCVIDGLAYDNPPGSRHPTRWQDTEELLSAGIAVISSINIQYVAELRDQVAAITGKPVRETVPVSFLQRAEEIELVDAPADEPPERIQRLAKLREIALVLAADVVDAQLAEYLRQHCIDQHPGAQERILVCVTPRANITEMLETGRIIAERFHGKLTVAYVRQPAISDADRLALEEKMATARQAGASIEILEGADPVAAILSYARAQGVTQLFVGHTQRDGLWPRLWGNPVEKLIRGSSGMDVRVFPQAP